MRSSPRGCSTHSSPSRARRCLMSGALFVISCSWFVLNTGLPEVRKASSAWKGYSCWNISRPLVAILRLRNMSCSSSTPYFSTRSCSSGVRSKFFGTSSRYSFWTYQGMNTGMKPFVPSTALVQITWNGLPTPLAVDSTKTIVPFALGTDCIRPLMMSLAVDGG